MTHHLLIRHVLVTGTQPKWFFILDKHMRISADVLVEGYAERCLDYLRRELPKLLADAA